MSLPILVLLVVVGITAAVLAVHLTGGSKIAAIRDSAHARDLFAADFPDEPTGEASLTTERHSAFMTLPGERVAIVQSFGDGFFTRIVSVADIATIAVRDPATISIRFKDFTWTGGHFHFDHADTARAVSTALGGDKTRA
jgi:hypothetical protein